MRLGRREHRKTLRIKLSLDLLPASQAVALTLHFFFMTATEQQRKLLEKCMFLYGRSGRMTVGLHSPRFMRSAVRVYPTDTVTIYPIADKRFVVNSLPN